MMLIVSQSSMSLPPKMKFECDTITSLAKKSILLDCRPYNSPNIIPQPEICGIFKIYSSSLYLKRFDKGLLSFSKLIDSFEIFQNIVLESQATVYFLGIEVLSEYAERFIKELKNIFPDISVFSLVSDSSLLSFQTIHEPVLKIAFTPSPTSDDSLSEILPNFFLTSIIGASEANLHKNGIFNVISVINTNIKFPAQFKHLHFDLADSCEVNIGSIFSQTFDFIDACLASNQKVVVHCHAGISRSASVVIAYIMRKQKMTFDNAFKFVRSKRSIVSPNLSFCGALMKFEKEF